MIKAITIKMKANDEIITAEDVGDAFIDCVKEGRMESNAALWYLDLISQTEIYNQVWSVKHMQEEGSRSKEAIELVEEFIERLEEIPDGGAELFPFEHIEKLREQYFVIK